MSDTPIPVTPYVEVYRGEDGGFYWTRKAANHEPVADGAEGYIRWAAAIAAAGRTNPGLPIHLLDDDADGTSDQTET